MKKEQDVLCTVFYDFAILSLIITMTLLFLIATNTINVVGAQQPLPPSQKTLPIVSPSISRLNTTGQAASQNAESLVRSMMDPSSLMSTVINQTGASKTNTSSTGPQISAATNGSSNNTNNNGSSSSNAPSASMATTTNMQNIIVTNVDTLLLAHQIIPPKDFIPLYDTSPYTILNGHLDAKIPCDANYAPSLQILVGHLPSVKPVQLQLVKEYSQPGNICMYHVNIGSTITTSPDGGKSLVNAGGTGQQGNTTSINSALLLRNPSDYMVVLPNTSAVVIGVNKIMPTVMTENNNNSSSSQSALPSHQITLTGGNTTNHVQESSGQISSILNSMAGLDRQTAR
ncbi:MAG TPA: hypothetical protein VI278_01465 [Nitrososphaeraceae archaeon]